MPVVTLETQDGAFTAHFTERGLARLDFPNASRRVARSVATADDAPPDLPQWSRLTRLALEEALRGRAPRSLPPLDLSSGTAFQQEIWRALLLIPPGETRSYGELAGLAGRPRAVRAAGRACGANPIPVLVPCHRVLRKGGGLGGYSCGIKWKKVLLAREGALTPENW